MKVPVESRTAIVTGGSSGIGAAICAALAADGVRVFNADIAPPDEASNSATHVQCDIGTDADVTTLFATVIAKAGGIDILVNNAGGAGSSARLDAMSSEAWDSSLALLLGGPRRMITAAIPVMRAQGRGAIVNIASICADQPGWGGSAYSVAKAALTHLTRVAAAELASDGIRVNAVSPGFIPTPIFGRSRGYDAIGRGTLATAIRAEASTAQPLRRAGLPEDIAAAVRFLASDAARFITGETLRVDGGLRLAPAHAWDEASKSPVLRAIAAGERRMQDEASSGQEQ